MLCWTTEELKTSIRDEINNITPEDLKKVMENVLKRARLCEAENYHHLRDIIFHNKSKKIPHNFAVFKKTIFLKICL